MSADGKRERERERERERAVWRIQEAYAIPPTQKEDDEEKEQEEDHASLRPPRAPSSLLAVAQVSAMLEDGVCLVRRAAEWELSRHWRRRATSTPSHESPRGSE